MEDNESEDSVKSKNIKSKLSKSSPTKERQQDTHLVTSSDVFPDGRPGMRSDSRDSIDTSHVNTSLENIEVNLMTGSGHLGHDLDLSQDSLCEAVFTSQAPQSALSARHRGSRTGSQSPSSPISARHGRSVTGSQSSRGSLDSIERSSISSPRTERRRRRSEG